MSKTDLEQTCCCCWEQFGRNKKVLRFVNPAVEDLVKLYIFPGYSTKVEDYPTKVCTNCYRNFYLLKEGKCSRGAWGLKVTQVSKT